MGIKKLLRNYVSPIDKFIHRFDEEHPQLSKSQLQEIEKYKRIYKLRDNPNATDETKLPEGLE